MTVIGWLQIAIFMAAIGLLTRPLGGYLAESTPASAHCGGLSSAQSSECSTASPE